MYKNNIINSGAHEITKNLVLQIRVKNSERVKNKHDEVRKVLDKNSRFAAL